MRQIPAGTLPADDDMLALFAGYSRGNVATWLKVKERVLAGIWFVRADGRLQCGALTEGIMRAIGKPPTPPAELAS